jgi:adenine deaminase
MRPDAPGAEPHQNHPMHDLVIRGGTVADGTGAAARRADLAVDDGVIVAVGAVEARGRRTIDADGLLVTPGIDDDRIDGQTSGPAPDPFSCTATTDPRQLRRRFALAADRREGSSS